jgi:hypothetical protein
MEQQGPKMEQRGWSTTERGRSAKERGMNAKERGWSAKDQEWSSGDGAPRSGDGAATGNPTRNEDGAGWSSDRKSNTQRGRCGMERTCKTDAAGARVQVHRAGAAAGTREREQQRSGMKPQGWSNKERPHQQTWRGKGTRCSCQSGAGAQSGARARSGIGSYKDSGAEQVQRTERSRSRYRTGSESRVGAHVASERQEIEEQSGDG